MPKSPIGFNMSIYVCFMLYKALKQFQIKKKNTISKLIKANIPRYAIEKT